MQDKIVINPINCLPIVEAPNIGWNLHVPEEEEEEEENDKDHTIFSKFVRHLEDNFQNITLQGNNVRIVINMSESTRDR